MEGELSWRVSSYSEGANNCVQVRTDEVRDSKHPTGPTLTVDLGSLVAFLSDKARD